MSEYLAKLNIKPHVLENGESRLLKASTQGASRRFRLSPITKNSHNVLAMFITTVLAHSPLLSQCAVSVDVRGAITDTNARHFFR